MFIVSVSGFEVVGLFNLWKFFRLALSLRTLTMAAKGYIAIDIFRNGRVFYIVKVWHSTEEMQAFAQSDKYVEIMRKGQRVIKSSKNTSYSSSTLPTRAGVVVQWNEDAE